VIRCDCSPFDQPIDQPCGQREFHVRDEDCTLVFFGQVIG